MTELVIDVKGLDKSFGDNHAVNNVSLQVNKGEIFGFLGPNGSGKTTTIRMLCGLLTPDHGKGHCLGFDILKQSLQIKNQVGYMTQRYSFYEDLTIQENLEFVARVYGIPNRKQHIEKIIQDFGFQDRRHQLTGELSGGWKQRVALGACLLHDPKLLLLDEPTAGVDPKARRDFWEQLHRLSQEGITTLVSTHYMDEAERCTRLAYISKGKLLIHGRIQEIIERVNLHTWSVSGDNLSKLADELRTIPEIEQVIIFGESLHVSSQDETRLLHAIKPYQNDHYKWQQVDRNIEDIFIHLMDEKKIK